MTLWIGAELNDQLEEAERLLRKHLKPESIAAVIRRPVADLGGRSLLETARSDPELALETVRSMFNWNRITGS